MSILVDIIRADILGLRNSLFRGGRKGLGTLIGFLVYAAFGIAVWYGAFRLFVWLDDLLAAYPRLLRVLQINILSGATIGSFVLMLMSGMRYTYDKTFESGDTSFLLSNPVSARTVFASKFVEAYGFNWMMGFSVGLFVYFGYAQATGVYLIFLTALAAYSLAALMFHSLISLVLLLIMRYLPAKTLKQLFVVIAAGAGVAIVLFSQIVSSGFTRDGTVSELEIIEQLGEGDLWKFSYLPHMWVVNSSIAPAGDPVRGLLVGFVPLVLVSAVLAVITLMLSERMFLAGWGSAAEHTGCRRKASGVGVDIHPRAGILGRTSGFGPVWGIIEKEFRLLKREPLAWYQLAISAIVLGFYVYNISGGGARGGGLGGSHLAAKSMTIIMTALLMGVSQSQLGGVAISREGKVWWYMSSSPVSAASLYIAKFLFAYIPSFLFASIAMVAFQFVPGLPQYPLAVSLGLSALMLVGIISLELWMDAAYPDFSLKIEFGAGRRSSGTGKLLVTMLAAMLLIIAMGGILMLPLYIKKLGPLAQLSVTGQRVLMGFLLFILTIGIGLAALRDGTRRLERLMRGS